MCFPPICQTSQLEARNEGAPDGQLRNPVPQMGRGWLGEKMEQARSLIYVFIGPVNRISSQAAEGGEI